MMQGTQQAVMYAASQGTQMTYQAQQTPQSVTYTVQSPRVTYQAGTTSMNTMNALNAAMKKGMANAVPPPCSSRAWPVNFSTNPPPTMMQAQTPGPPSRSLQGSVAVDAEGPGTSQTVPGFYMQPAVATNTPTTYQVPMLANAAPFEQAQPGSPTMAYAAPLDQVQAPQMSPAMTYAAPLEQMQAPQALTFVPADQLQAMTFAAAPDGQMQAVCAMPMGSMSPMQPMQPVFMQADGQQASVDQPQEEEFPGASGQFAAPGASGQFAAPGVAPQTIGYAVQTPNGLQMVQGLGAAGGGACVLRGEGGQPMAGQVLMVPQSMLTGGGAMMVAGAAGQTMLVPGMSRVMLVPGMTGAAGMEVMTNETMGFAKRRKGKLTTNKKSKGCC